jgi:hypothetical protein
MTYAGTGSEGFNQSVRLRRQAAEEAAKPKQVAEIDAIAEAFYQAETKRLAKIAEAERQQIASGRLRIL